MKGQDTKFFVPRKKGRIIRHIPEVIQLLRRARPSKESKEAKCSDFKTEHCL
jgi:hypothetical protein